jgi:hypothetical protein
MTDVVNPNKFQTKTTPWPKENQNRIQYDFDALLGRRQGVAYVFVDYLFQVGDGLHGAVGTEMRVVTKEEAKRRESEYRNPDTSPYYWKYEEKDPAVGWSTWIKSKLRQNEHDVLYNTSYNEVYGEQTKEKAIEDGLLNEDEIHLTTCVYGGSLEKFTEENLAEVYDPELLRLVREAETNGVKHLYGND